MDKLTLWYIGIFAIDIAIAVIALIGLRYAMAVFVGVHVKDELDEKDNFAFGIAIAGGVVALSLVLSAAVSGDVAVSMTSEFIGVLSYSVLGVVLLKVGLLIQDSLILRSFSLKEQLQSRNLAAAMVSAANLVAVGLIVRGAVLWVEDDSISGLPLVVAVFAVSQIILMCVTLLRSKVYAKRHEGGVWQDAIREGNLALAIRYAGQIVATAFALTAVGGLISYVPEEIFYIAVLWLGFGLSLLVILWVLYRLITPIILTKIDIVEEVDNQQNIGIAWIEAAIFIGVATIIYAFLA